MLRKIKFVLCALCVFLFTAFIYYYGKYCNPRGLEQEAALFIAKEHLNSLAIEARMHVFEIRQENGLWIFSFDAISDNGGIDCTTIIVVDTCGSSDVSGGGQCVARHERPQSNLSHSNSRTISVEATPLLAIQRSQEVRPHRICKDGLVGIAPQPRAFSAFL